VDAYGQYFCPIARGAEIFATRWTPIIVRNLLLGATTLSEIHAGAPGMPRSLLTQRMRQLEHAGIVQRRAKPSGRGWLYELTPAGRDLEPVCDALGVWGAKWLEAAPGELDPFVLLWAICRSITPERIPNKRVVIRLNFRDLPKHPFWLLLQQPECEVCCKPPGYDEDLFLTSDTQWLAKWYMGRISLGNAIQAGVITIDGPRALIRQFSRLDGLGRFSAISPAYDSRATPVTAGAATA
jgi:DNA-binding HxlR family transcriptional regulator